MSALAIDWETALQEHARWLRAVVYSRLRDPDAVDDVMQEVAAAAVKQNSPLQDASKIAPWLYRVAIRQALLYRRGCGRRRKLTDGFACELQGREHTATDPLDWLLADERRARVRQALEGLPRRDVEILLLKYQEDWSYREIAGHLGLSESAVEARLHRARGRLRRQLNRIESGQEPAARNAR